MHKLLIALSMLALAGCGRLDFTQTLLHPLTPIQISTAQGVEVVSSSTTGVRTLVNGYTVDASVGAVTDKLQVSTPNGYTIYNGVKGEVVSEVAH